MERVAVVIVFDDVEINGFFQLTAERDLLIVGAGGGGCVQAGRTDWGLEEGFVVEGGEGGEGALREEGSDDCGVEGVRRVRDCWVCLFEAGWGEGVGNANS